jgi:hypothetical protein
MASIRTETLWRAALACISCGLRLHPAVTNTILAAGVACAAVGGWTTAPRLYLPVNGRVAAIVGGMTDVGVELLKQPECN